MDLSNHRYIIFFPFLFVLLSLSITNCRYTSSLQVCAACNLFFRPFVVDFCRSLSEDHFSLFFISPHSVEFYFLWWSLPFVPLFSQHHLPIGTHGQPHTFSSLSPFFPSPPLSLSLFTLFYSLFTLSFSLLLSSCTSVATPRPISRYPLTCRRFFIQKTPFNSLCLPNPQRAPFLLSEGHWNRIKLYAGFSMPPFPPGTMKDGIRHGRHPEPVPRK